MPIFGLDGQVVLGVFFVAFVWWGRTLALDARTSQKTSESAKYDAGASTHGAYSHPVPVCGVAARWCPLG